MINLNKSNPNLLLISLGKNCRWILTKRDDKDRYVSLSLFPGKDIEQEFGILILPYRTCLFPSKEQNKNNYNWYKILKTFITDIQI